MFDSDTKRPTPTGTAVLCYLIWGFAPLAYLPMYAFGAGAVEIIIHRSLWAFLCAGVLVLVLRQVPAMIAAMRDVRVLGLLLVSSVLMASNWGVFVWAIDNGHTIETSLGYYLNPLLNMAAGAMLFSERIDRFGKGAIALAVVGVVLQGIAIGHVPWVSLYLGFSFAIYGVVRKKLPVDALPGLTVECLFLVPLAVVAFVLFERSGNGHFFNNMHDSLWLMLTGPLTVAPLALFAYAARRMPLSTMGFIQFIAPTISFCIGLSLGEKFNVLRGVSFVFIWGGAAVFAYGAWRRYRMLKDVI